MTAIPFPLLSAPGRHPQAAGGRLINTIVEKLPETAGQRLLYWRAPGLRAFGTAAGAPRGFLPVGNTLYYVVGDKVFTYSAAGGAGTQLGGTVPGTAPVTMARNNATNPDIVIVVPGDGAFVITGGAVANYPDADVGQPNSVVFHKGFFIFTYGDGKTRSSKINSTDIDTLNVATAESKPDTLYRAIPLGNGQLLLVGSSTMEVWGGINDTGYPFSYIATIARGIVGPYAISGHEDGFGKGIFFVGDDFSVHTLNGYTPQKVSTTEVDLAIEREADKSKIRVSTFIAEGHAYVAVQTDTWCWCYDVTTGVWHERQSYLQTYWRAAFPVKAFDRWLCGDTKTGNVLQIDGRTHDEVGDPLRMRIETGPIGGFPSPLRVNGIELYLTKGVGQAEGDDPVQTDPMVEISMSPDGGNRWLNPRVVPVGRQALMSGRVRAHNFGHGNVQGVRWRFDFSSNVPMGFMGADMQAEKLR